ncbi:alpha/beta hydrolase family protein [Mycobacterium ulcerans str. Harvey]|uniref:Alpha/beta hydrolase family protein n=1 Tax=Mycobacterium ulcerans str. Harvey TaxID=1299332 RepID=A0ABP3AEH8_MYCUL|nr:alpha/beta hydrolase family protein [Mycobacterium ulcerans str. Harvey]
MYTYDAPWHRGRDVDDPYPISTERFVADLGEAVAELGGPARLVGHSMGALHSWCLAAERPGWCRRWWSRTWRRISSAAPPARGSRGCTHFPLNSIRPIRYSRNSGRLPGSTFWKPSTIRPRGGACMGTPRGGSRSPLNGVRATTGHNGGRCGSRRF